MAATPLIGAPFSMNAMAGPEPIRMSIEPAAAAVCMRASPVNAIDTTSRPFLAKMPVRMPISTGVNVKASATALPTRSFSAAGATTIETTIRAAASDVRASIIMARLRAASVSWPGQERLVDQPAHVRLLRQRFHVDKAAAQYRQRLRLEMAVVVEHWHHLVIEAAGGRFVGTEHVFHDGDGGSLVLAHEADGFEPAREEAPQHVGPGGDSLVGAEDDVDVNVLQQVAEAQQNASLAAL